MGDCNVYCGCQEVDEKKKKLLEIIDKYKNADGALIPVLHEAQDVYGYLPISVQKVISQSMDIPLAEVYGVVTFYSQFTLKEKGKYKVSMCLGTACYVKGAGLIVDELKSKLGIKVGEVTEDMKFSLDTCRCIGACGLAPVIMINDEVYGKITPDDVAKIIDSYKNK